MNNDDIYLQKAYEYAYNGDINNAINTLQQCILEGKATYKIYEELGIYYNKQQEYDKAYNAYIKALDMNNESANGHYLIAHYYLSQNDLERSYAHYQRALELFPTSAPILSGLGWCMVLRGQEAQGMALLQRSLTIKPDDIAILLDNAVASLYTSHIEKARVLLNKILSLDPKNKMAQHLLDTLDNQNKDS